MKQKEVMDFVNEKTGRIKPLIKKAGLAYFNAITSGKEEFYKEYENTQIAIEKIFNSKKDFKKVSEFYNSKLKDGFLKRQVTLLRNSYLGSQGNIELIKEIVRLSAKLEKKFNIFRAEINGKKLSDNEIKKILETETDSKRVEEAWSASKKQGEVVSKDIINLAKLRNQLAKSLGFKNYYSFSLEIHEQNEGEIEKIFEDMREKTDKPFIEAKKEIDNFLSKQFRINKDELRPWHYQDLFFQKTPEIYSIDLDKCYNGGVIDISEGFYKSIGIEVSGVLRRSDLYERDGKYQHACCIDIDRSGDVRIVENVKNDENWMETTLHELGHAIYCKSYAAANLPYLLKDNAHIFITEAIAQLFGRNSKNINFANRYSEVKFDEKEFRGINEKMKKSLKLRQLAFCRWSLVMFNFERELYKNPNQDLNKLWWNLVKKYQMIDFYRDKPDWASKIHFVSSPVYYHNYLLGEIFASQIHSYMINNILKEQKINDYDYSGNKEVGNYLTENIFSKGISLRWDALIKKATGEELTSKYWIKQFAE